MPGVRRRSGGVFAALAALAVAGVVTACGSAAAPTATPAPTPSSTAAPTATPMPGKPLAASYRPEGLWLVTFSLPGDMVREVFELTLTCPDGTCDAIAQISDAAGGRIGKGTFQLRDRRYVYEAAKEATVDCTAGGRTVRRGARERVVTQLVLASFPIVGTANARPMISGTRVVTLEPTPDSACERSVTTYPAIGVLLKD